MLDLDSIWIENFKSYKTGQSLPLAPITLMIGANASGSLMLLRLSVF